MSEPWIRVHANLAAKPVIARAVAALRVSENEAIGALVRFWGNASQHVVGGMVGDLPDRQIEQWAGWTRKRGRFAAFVREHHLDADGRIREWDEYQGRLETRRERERERLRVKREAERSLRNSTQDVAPTDAQQTQDVRNVLVPARAVRDETIRNETNNRPSVGRGSEGWRPIQEQRLAARLTTDAGRQALAVLLAASWQKAAIVGEIEACLDGLRGEAHRATAAEIDAVICDYVANEFKSGKWNGTLFRGCVRRQVAQRDRPPPGAPGASTDPFVAGLDEWVRRGQAKETKGAVEA